jgi:hypothetical protein
MIITTILIIASKRKGNLQEKIGPKKADRPCPAPLDMELKIARVPNQPDLSSAGIASEIIEYPTGRTHPNPAPLKTLEITSNK